MTDFPPFKKVSIYDGLANQINTTSDSTIERKLGKSPLLGAPYGTSDYSVTFTLAQIEEQHILKVLKYHEGNKTQAARTLGISIKTLYNKLPEYGQMPKKEIFPDYGKIEQAVLATHYKCIKAFSDGYKNDFKVGNYYEVLDMKQGYVLVKMNYRSKARWLSAKRFDLDGESK
jgi:hypothetical protein